jgi:hypothetical protein
MAPTWRDHPVGVLSAMIFGAICGLAWGLPIWIVVFLAALCAFGSARVLARLRA